ncbi:MAG: alpha/beta fold hydrolase [Bacteroidota bacterium]
MLITDVRHKKRLIQAGKITWETHLAGDGKRVLFAFHGFNRRYDDLIHLSSLLTGDYKVVSVSLFYHGSQFERVNDIDAFTADELRTGFQELVSAFHVESYSAIGHSFGGRLALNMVEYGPSGLQELFLLAPDALRYHPGYRFLTGNRFGRFLMGNFKKDPSRVISMIKLFGKVGFYSPKTANYFIHQITHQKVRFLVYDSWMTHRLTIPNLDRVAKKINDLAIRTELIFGRSDSLIPISQGKRFQKKILHYGTLHIIEGGHRLYEQTTQIAKIIQYK